MNQLTDVKENILSVLNGGDILLIIPPFSSIFFPVHGPHILQTLAEKKGYKSDILYLNILLTSILGNDFAEALSLSNLFSYWKMLHERLFARSAYGLPPLGESPESITDEALSTRGNKKEFVKTDFAPGSLDLETYKKLESICHSFIDTVAPIITSLQYKMIGCTVRIGQTNAAVSILNRIKRESPGTVTLIGGSNCEGEMAEGIASLSDSIDFIFSGESELPFERLLEKFSKGQLPPGPIIPGIPLKNPDDLPLPDFHPFTDQLGRFLAADAPKEIALTYETSRGCWWGQKKKCTFCSCNNAGIKFRKKSSTKVLEELSYLKEHYPDVAVAMTDNLIPDVYPKELFPTFGETRNYPEIYLFYIKANLRLKDLVNLKNAKVHKIIPGIETLSTGLLKLMNKGITARDNLLFLRNARAAGINLLWVMLWGIPGDKAEYYEEILNILPLIRHLQPPQKFFRIYLERFSYYFEKPLDYDIKNLRPWEVYKMIYPEWANIDKLAFEFVGDYPCEADEHPELIQEIADELAYWGKLWKNTHLTMFPLADYYVVHDSRNIPGTSQSHILDASRAKDIMALCIYEESENQKWAVGEKLGVVVDSWYVPLVTAAPELLLDFEEETMDSSSGQNHI